jgi:RNA polymerase sigma factor (sigma-70 family)
MILVLWNFAGWGWIITPVVVTLSTMSSGVETIFVEQREKLIRFLQLRGAGDAAEDLIQEVWFKISGPLSGPIASPQAFLFKVAHNVMLDWHRSERQRANRDRNWTEGQSGSNLEQDSRPDQEQIAISRSMLQKAMEEIDALGEPTGTIFRQFRIESIPQREIAASLGVSLPTVEKHLQKAYRAMAEVQRQFNLT